MNAVSEWRLRPCSEDSVIRLVRALAISPWVARVLVSRGIESPDEARAFLEPESQPYHDPFELPGMDSFVQRIDRAVRKKEKVIVHGDYDADGVTSSAILSFALQRVGLSPKVFLPERFEGGYGVQPEWVEKQREEKVDLIITIDCGSGAKEAVAKAKELGIDLIVCDHHTPDPDLPPTVAHINPHLPDSKYPFKDLCAAGLALKLSHSLIALVPPSFQADYRENLPFDLAMVGTIADVMPLLGENRRIVVDGLDRTKTNPTPGLRILLESAGCDPAGVNCETIAFQVAPRLNAAGRLESPRIAFDLLTGQDPDLLREAASELEKINKQRKKLAARCAEEAVAKLEKDPPHGAAVVADEKWHRGILGIVAARVAETFGLPTFVASIEGDTAHGSARVPDGWNAVDLLECAAEFTERAGGHAGAAGFAVPIDRWEEFADCIRAAAQEALDEPVAAILEVDAYLTEGRLDELFEEVSRLEPYGVGFPAPIYSLNRFESGSRHSLFGENHLKIQLGMGADRIEAVGFGMGEWAQDLGKRPMDLALEYGENHWNGRTFLRPRILAIRPALAEAAIPASKEEVIRIDTGVGWTGPSIVVWDARNRGPVVSDSPLRIGYGPGWKEWWRERIPGNAPDRFEILWKDYAVLPNEEWPESLCLDYGAECPEEWDGEVVEILWPPLRKSDRAWLKDLIASRPGETLVRFCYSDESVRDWIAVSRAETSRDNLATLYRALAKSPSLEDLFKLGLSQATVLSGLEAFIEEGLARFEEDRIAQVPDPPKANLEESEFLKGWTKFHSSLESWGKQALSAPVGKLAQRWILG